jgi:cobalt-zinc-cadmium efflux system outer membrane protein
VGRKSYILPWLLLGIAGCGTYRPAPLDDTFIRAELIPPGADSVRTLGLALQHPLLEPLAYDPTDGLSPDEAAVFAVVANPDLRAVRKQRGVSRAALIAAGILPNPQLSASADLPVGDQTGALTATGLGLSLDLNPFFTRGAETGSARAALAQVDLDIAWQEWQVAQQARLQVYRGAFLDRQLALAHEEEDALARNREAVNRAAQGHLVTEIEQAAAEDAYYTARGARLDLERQRTASRLELNRLLGLPPAAVLPLQMGEIPFAPLEGRGGESDSADCAAASAGAAWEARWLDADSLLSRLEDRRLDLLALRHGYESREEALRAAVLRRFPRINIGVNRLRDNAAVLSLGPAVTIDLPFLDRNQGEIATARATREQLRQEYVARLFAARAEVADLLDAGSSRLMEWPCARAMPTS